MSHARIQRGEAGVPDPLKTFKAIGFLSNTGLDPLENHNAIKLWPSSAHQRNAISMMFRWGAVDGPLLVVFGPSHPPPPH